MLLYRRRSDGDYLVRDGEAAGRMLLSDPFAAEPEQWQYGDAVEDVPIELAAPLEPGKIVGVGRNYAAHARELGNEVPSEPVLFLKSPGSVVGQASPIVLPPESSDVQFEGEIAVVLARGLTRAGRDEAAAAVLGVTCANDVTARDLQRGDATFARAKSFDTFCPLGPAVRVGADLASLSLRTRLNGVEAQAASAAQMLFDIPDLLVYISRMMTLFAGDVVLTGTPSGVAPLADGDVVEVEVDGVGVLSNRVEALAREEDAQKPRSTSRSASRSASRTKADS